MPASNVKKGLLSFAGFSYSVGDERSRLETTPATRAGPATLIYGEANPCDEARGMLNSLRSPLLLASFLSILGSGCSVFSPNDEYKYEKPLIAVIAFENRARLPLDWPLGDGVAGLLETSLHETRKFRVLDREDVDLILREQDFQRSGRTRPEQVVPEGRILNAHYLIRGVITEFAHVQLNGWDFGIGPLRIGGGGEHAVVNMTIRVTEVESAEVVFSKVVEGKVYAGGVDFGAIYDHVAFGGNHFYQTPLGRALKDALDDAVDTVQTTIGRRLWRPLIASVQDGRVTISGGENRRVQVGSRWVVRGAGKRVVNPETGDVLGHEPGGILGRVRVVDVKERYAVAEPELGSDFTPGQRLEPYEEPKPQDFVPADTEVSPQD